MSPGTDRAAGRPAALRPLPPPGSLDGLLSSLGRLRSRFLGDPAVPTLMHVTHAKAGSTWINNILCELFHSRTAPRGRTVAGASGGDLSAHVFAPGRVYPAMFLTREQFLAHPELADARRFFVMRDLRDTLVSLYFSLKISHPVDAEGRTQRHRDQLNARDFEDGLVYLLEELLPRAAAIQASWIGHGEIILRYEDLTANGFHFLREAFIARMALPVSEGALARAIHRTKFETVFRRVPGQEDVHSHGRKGQPGDWKNHFSPAFRRRFAGRFGQLLVETGYEEDLAWAS